MDKARGKKINLGIFISIGLLLFIALIYYTGRQKSLFGSSIEIQAFFRNVSGLQDGNRVRFSGIAVGTVRDIEIANDSMAKVVMHIDEDAGRFIMTDAVATIDSDGLMGSKIVTISTGRSGNYIEDGDQIRTKEPVDIDDVITSFKSTSDNAAELSENLLIISQRIRRSEGLLGQLVSDSLLAERVENVIVSLEQTSRNMSGITTQAERAVHAVNDGNGLLNNVLYDTTWSSAVTSALDTLQYSGRNLAVASRDLRLFMENLSNNDGAVDKLLNDSTVAKNLEETLINIKEGTEDLDAVMNTLNESWILNLFSGSKE